MSNMAKTVGLWDLQRPIGWFHTQYFPNNTSEGARGRAFSFTHTFVADARQSYVGCRRVFSFTHTFVAEAAQLLGRPPHCLDACSDGCNGVIFLICWGKIVYKSYLWYIWYLIWYLLTNYDDLATIAVKKFLGDHHNDQGQSTRKIVHYDSPGAPLWLISILEGPIALWDRFLEYISDCRARGLWL